MFRNQPCVYMHTDKLRNPIRVGVASKGLESRYRGGTGYSLDAAMHDSGNLIFVAPMSAALCRAVELELIWRGRNLLHYNNVGKLTPPIVRLNLVHEGDLPRLDGFEAWERMRSLVLKVRPNLPGQPHISRRWRILHDQIHRKRVYRPLQFQKRSQQAIGTHDETISVAMRVHNPDRLAFNIDCWDPA